MKKRRKNDRNQLSKSVSFKLGFVFLKEDVLCFLQKNAFTETNATLNILTFQNGSENRRCICVCVRVCVCVSGVGC